MMFWARSLVNECYVQESKLLLKMCNASKIIVFKMAAKTGNTKLLGTNTRKLQIFHAYA